MNGFLIGLVGVLLVVFLCKKVANLIIYRRGLKEFYRRVAESKANGTFSVSTDGLF